MARADLDDFVGRYRYGPPAEVVVEFVERPRTALEHFRVIAAAAGGRL